MLYTIIMDTYYAINGKDMDVNIAGNMFLDKITMGLWDKVGIPIPLSEDDAELISRILWNYAKLQRSTFECGDRTNTEWNSRGYVQEENEKIIWIEKIAEFFEESGGLTDGEDRMTDVHQPNSMDNEIEVFVEQLGNCVQVTVSVECLIPALARSE